MTTGFVGSIGFNWTKLTRIFTYDYELMRFLCIFQFKYMQHLNSCLSITLDYAWYADGRGLGSQVRQHSFVEFGHAKISTAILSFPLIQEGQLSVTGDRMCT